MTWAKDTRPLPGNWQTLRREVLARDGRRCTWIEREDGSRCSESGAPSNPLEVDHITPRWRGGTDEVDNLRTLCQWHHKRVTAHDRPLSSGAYQPRKRPRERHPGLL